jgi:signal transduction histidine kinase
MLMSPLARLSRALLSTLRRRTVRLRLTLLYSVLFIASGAALIGITNVLVAHQLGVPIRILQSGSGSIPSKPGPIHAPLGDSLQVQQATDLHQFLVWSWIALGIMAIVSIALGWLVAGRVLRPVRTMTTTARQISEHNLHERLALQGPHDEFKDLGDTIDGLLARLEGAFDSQTRFVANASHELRTPLTLSRTMLQVALANPALTLESLRSTCAEVLEAGREQDQLIEALLTLARSQRGLDHRDTFDLAVVASDVVQSRQPEATTRGLSVDTMLNVAPISGDALLVERLVSNLVDNALRHNIPNGHIRVLVGISIGRATLSVSNSGPSITSDQIDRLLQPFQRLDGERGGDHDGVGLGLSIVAAITSAHGATVRVHPGLEGGLDIEVSFPSTLGRSAPPLLPLPDVRETSPVEIARAGR